MLDAAEPSHYAGGNDTVGKIIDARIEGAKIVDGRIVDGRIVEAKTAEPTGDMRRQRERAIGSRQINDEIVAFVGLGLVVLMIFLL